MRIFLFILILSPLLSFNQTKLGLWDLKSISSKSTFQKVVLENGFSKNDEQNLMLRYGHNLQKNFSNLENSRASAWAYFDKSNETFEFIFFKYNIDSQNTYNEIVLDIQSSCNFHSIDEKSDYDIIYYGCPGAKFQGIIGYYDEGNDNLRILTKIPSRN